MTTTHHLDATQQTASCPRLRVPATRLGSDLRSELVTPHPGPCAPSHTMSHPSFDLVLCRLLTILHPSSSSSSSFVCILELGAAASPRWTEWIPKRRNRTFQHGDWNKSGRRLANCGDRGIGVPSPSPLLRCDGQRGRVFRSRRWLRAMTGKLLRSDRRTTIAPRADLGILSRVRLMMDGLISRLFPAPCETCPGVAGEVRGAHASHAGVPRGRGIIVSSVSGVRCARIRERPATTRRTRVLRRKHRAER